MSEDEWEILLLGLAPPPRSASLAMASMRAAFTCSWLVSTCLPLLGAALQASQCAAETLPSASGTASADPMLVMLRQRVAKNPEHSDSWRLIGRLEAKRGDTAAAMQAISRALTLDPDNAAAHFDLGELLLQSGDQAAAEEHFQRCVAIAPQSGYAAELHDRKLAPLTASVNASEDRRAQNRSTSIPAQLAVASTLQDPELDQVGYEIQTFDGADDLDRRLHDVVSMTDPTLKRLRVFLETGVLYNSNVALTPISRDLPSVDAASFQGFLNPEFEWIALRRGRWRGGPLGRGYFTVNEADFSQFNLASFQPGAFLERDLQVGQGEWIARLEYLYSLDLLDGQRFGDRHSLTASVTAIRPDLDIIYSYITTNFLQFNDDGVAPRITSLDGTTILAGTSRFFQTESAWMPTYSLGADIESANTEGDNFRYTAINTHGDATFLLHERWSFTPTGGLGYRSYDDFTGPVDRDELIWRLHAKLRWLATPQVAFSLVAGHDRFASDNEEFDAQRTEGGLIMTVVY